jgi:hypothetical protein
VLEDTKTSSFINDLSSNEGVHILRWHVKIDPCTRTLILKKKLVERWHVVWNHLDFGQKNKLYYFYIRTCMYRRSHRRSAFIRIKLDGVCVWGTQRGRCPWSFPLGSKGWHRWVCYSCDYSLSSCNDWCRCKKPIYVPYIIRIFEGWLQLFLKIFYLKIY